MVSSNYFIHDNSDIENQKIEAAKKLYQKGDYAAALKLYLDLINTSYSYKLYYEIGRCYYKLNNTSLAEEHFLRSIALEEYKNPSYFYLGNLYFKQENKNKAIEYWSIAHSYKPEDENVCLNLATTYFSFDNKFQSVFFYEKYLKYAKDKNSAHYLEIKKTINNFVKLGNEFYQKALRAVQMKDNQTAIQSLLYAVKNHPTNFDANYLLGKLYLEEKDYMHSLIYLKQAYCIDNKSLDVLENLTSVLINLGDFTSAYCTMKRILPLVIHNQKEYLEIIKTIKHLEDSFDKLSYQGHENWAKQYFSENNYHYALFEYENCLLINGNLSEEYDPVVTKLRSFIKPEEKIIKYCIEKGLDLYSIGDYRQANKYFSKILILSSEDSSEYKVAKSSIVNV